MARPVPEINAGSMADIAFLLLIFFLVATTMDVDTGITRKLPPWVDETYVNPPEIKKRNIFTVLINTNNELLVQNEPTDITQLKKLTKQFIVNANDDPNLPEKENKNVPFFGNVAISKQVVSLQNDRGTKYETYLQVQNEIVAAYNELRNELAKKKFGKPFNKLNQEQMDAVSEIYPQRISEAEPKNVGEIKK